jgi:hypothetical protein
MREDVKRVYINVIIIIGRKDAGSEFKFVRQEMSADDWEAKFEYCLENFLIDVPAEFYLEEIQFQNTHEISEKFAELEEKNLFLISSVQEIEQSLEELKNEEKIMKKELTYKKISFEKILKVLKQNETSYFEIMHTKGPKTHFGGHTKNGKDNDEDDLDATEVLNICRNEIESVYKKTKTTDKDNKTDKIDCTSKETTDMLAEIETALDNKISELASSRADNEVEVRSKENIVRNGRKEKRQIITNQKQQKEEEQKQLKAQKDAKSKESAGFKGKVMMERSKKKSIKKKKVKVEVDPQIEERKRYIGDMF